MMKKNNNNFKIKTWIHFLKKKLIIHLGAMLVTIIYKLTWIGCEWNQQCFGVWHYSSNERTQNVLNMV
jgi:hypothetical protein